MARSLPGSCLGCPAWADALCFVVVAYLCNSIVLEKTACKEIHAWASMPAFNQCHRRVIARTAVNKISDKMQCTSLIAVISDGYKFNRECPDGNIVGHSCHRD